jgi:hypothetical protein
MKVTFSFPQNFGNKPYSGTMEVTDKLAFNVAFKKAVQSGAVRVHPRDARAVKEQATRDALAAARANRAQKGLPALLPFVPRAPKVPTIAKVEIVKPTAPAAPSEPSQGAAKKGS